MSRKNERAEPKTRGEASRNEPAASPFADARSREQARKQGSHESKPGATARKRRPPFVL